MLAAIKNKKWGLVVAFFTILLIYVAVTSYIDTGMGKDNAIYSELENPPTTKTKSVLSGSSGHLSDKSEVMSLINKLSPGFNSDSEVRAFQAELEEWKAARGYVTNANEYGGYSESILLDLAKNGDVQALITLGELRYRTQGFNGAAPFYLKAAVRGSTDALERIASIEEISHYSNAKSPEEKQRYMLKTLAWYKVASLRGDRLPELFMGNAFIANNAINLSAADNQRVAAIAEDLYKGMQDARNKLGLGDFDNSAPDSVKRYFEILERDNMKAKERK